MDREIKRHERTERNLGKRQYKQDFSKKEEKELIEKPRQIIAIGKRKEAIARASIKSGTGDIKINNIPLDILDIYRRLQILEPLRIAESTIGKLNFDINVNVRGGGIQGQAEAARLAIARALVDQSPCRLYKKQRA